MKKSILIRLYAAGVSPVESIKVYSFFTKNGFHGAFWNAGDAVAYYLPSFNPGILRFASFELNRYLLPSYLSKEEELLSLL